MTHALKFIKEYITDSLNNIIFSFSNMDKDRYLLVNKRINEINQIKTIKSVITELYCEKHLYKKISSFLFGDFIEVRFRDNDDVCYYFFKNDIISSMTLYKFFVEFEKTERCVFRMDIVYNSNFFNLIVNYLIYNDNKDNIGTLIYNNKSWLYLKDSDNFNNDIIFSMNYYQLKQFKKYVSYFKIKVLDYKIMAIIDIINLNIKSSNDDKKNKPLSKFI